MVMLRGVAQLVARLLWEQNAAGSSPVTPTTGSAGSQSRVSSLLFFCLSHDGKVGYEHSDHKDRNAVFLSLIR